MPIQMSQGNCQYTAINTIGTTTVNQGRQDGRLQAHPSAYYGYLITGTGTAVMGVAVLDIFPVQTGTGTVTTTTTLVSGTGTALNQIVPAGPAGLGIRVKGSLVVVTTGTAGTVLTLWD